MLVKMETGASGGGVTPETLSNVYVGNSQQTITLPHAPSFYVMLVNTDTRYTKYGSSVFDVANNTFFLPPESGSFPTFTVSGNQLTLLAADNANNFTYNFVVI